MGSCWVRCPVEAAKNLVATPHITVGWSKCRIVLFPSRGLQCYRCLEAGHVQQRCTGTVDRSRCCYRCGGMGHLAKDCQARAECPACRTLGRPAGHRIGGQGCTAARGAKGRKGGPKPSGPPPPGERPPASAAAAARAPDAVADVEMAVTPETPSPAPGQAVAASTVDAATGGDDVNE
ncbi:PREDICTED: insulinoma-associated protein 1-like [Trachymyrmex cornetzi]|nr:PREDICTED: insulinoma-associated protein 1-like [Trachymyrmex cornetzi]